MRAYQTGLLAILVTTLAVGIAPACSSDHAVPSAKTSDAALPGLPLPTVLPVHIDADEGCFTNPVRAVARSAAEWERIWARLSGGCIPPSAPVDFQHELIAVAAIGAYANTGASIVIDAVRASEDTVYIFVRERFPGSGCVTGQMITYPRAFAQIPQTSLPVRFVEDRQEALCK